MRKSIAVGFLVVTMFLISTGFGAEIKKGLLFYTVFFLIALVIMKRMEKGSG